MKISIPREIHPGETRTPLTPEGVARLIKLGAQLEVESALGLGSGFADRAYAAAGAAVVQDRRQLLASAEVILRLRKPPLAEIALLQPGCIHVSFLDPFNEMELVQKLAERQISALS